MRPVGHSTIKWSVLHRSRRRKCNITLADIGLDNLKAGNAQYEHSMGHELFKVAARTLQISSRKSDTVVRLGGDDFAVLLPETSLEGTKTFLESLRSHGLRAMRQCHWPVTFSGGSIAFSRPVPAEEMIRWADAPLFEVKRWPRDAINRE